MCIYFFWFHFCVEKIDDGLIDEMKRSTSSLRNRHRHENTFLASDNGLQASFPIRLLGNYVQLQQIHKRSVITNVAM